MVHGNWHSVWLQHQRGQPGVVKLEATGQWTSQSQARVLLTAHLDAMIVSQLRDLVRQGALGSTACPYNGAQVLPSFQVSV